MGGGGTGGTTTSGNCGNNVIDSGEQCDDGNTTPGDGCSATCQNENPKDCPGTALTVGASGTVVVTNTTVGGNDTFTNTAPGGGCTAGAKPGDDLVYAVTATTDGTMWAKLDAAYAESLLHVRTACPAGPPAQIACDSSASAGTTIVSFPVQQGHTYYVAVDSYDSTSGTFTLTLAMNSCGDGIVAGNEQCDDGNAVNDGNGCKADCNVDCPLTDFLRSSTMHCYQLVDQTALSWDDAHTACLALGSHWDLLAISQSAERDFIDNTVGPVNATSYWTGGNDSATEGTFVWTNGEPWWDGWLGGQPNGGSAQNCVALLGVAGQSNDACEDRLCSDQLAYICELSPAGLPQ